MSVILKPRLSEKAYGLAQTTNTYVIDVPANLNRQEITEAVEKQFEVSIKRVRTINRKGKAKRIMNTTGKRSANGKGTQASIKKAYITLNIGSHLPFFEAEEAQAVETAKAEAKAKKPAKEAKIVASKAPKEEKK